MATVFLIRHEEPEVRGVFLGQLDPPLSARGRAAAAQLCEIEAAAIYTSPLRRAAETAAFLRGEPVTLDELREISYGEWTGRTWAEIESAWSDVADWHSITPPGGEPWPAFLQRVDAAWTRIRAGAFPAAIVAHQGVNAALAALIAGRDPLSFTQNYGEVIQLEY